jgi:hypothetical protein
MRPDAARSMSRGTESRRLERWLASPNGLLVGQCKWSFLIRPYRTRRSKMVTGEGPGILSPLLKADANGRSA